MCEKKTLGQNSVYSEKHAEVKKNEKVRFFRGGSI